MCCALALSAHAQEQAPFNAGDYLDRALAHCLQGERAHAEEIFAYIEQNFAPPAGIRRLIELIRTENCTAASTAWLPDFLALQTGWTSNANQAPNIDSVVTSGGVPLTLTLSSSARQQPDNFIGIEGTKTLRWEEARVSFYGSLRNFQRVHDFDQLFFNTNAARNWQVGDYNFEATVSASAMILGGKDYYRSAGFGGTARRGELLLELMSMRSQYPANRVFDANVSQVRLGWDRLLADGWRTRARLGALLDQAESTRPGGTRRGFTSSLSLDITLPRKRALEFAARYDRSLSEQPYFSGLFDMRRDQRFEQLSATLSTPLDPVSSLEFSLKWINSADSVPFLAYRQHTAQVSWVRSLR